MLAQKVRCFYAGLSKGQRAVIRGVSFLPIPALISRM
jgi:hypothetical protein